MNVTTHLRNQLTAAVGHMRGTPNFEWDGRIVDRLLEVIEAHENCSHCNADDGGAV